MIDLPIAGPGYTKLNIHKSKTNYALTQYTLPTVTHTCRCNHITANPRTSSCHEVHYNILLNC